MKSSLLKMTNANCHYCLEEEQVRLRTAVVSRMNDDVSYVAMRHLKGWEGKNKVEGLTFRWNDLKGQVEASKVKNLKCLFENPEVINVNNYKFGKDVSKRFNIFDRRRLFTPDGVSAIEKIVIDVKSVIMRIGCC